MWCNLLRASFFFACGLQKEAWLFISPPLNSSCFHVWKLKTCVFQCAVWMQMPSVTPASNFLTWKEISSKEAETISLTHCSEMPCFTEVLCYAILVPLVDDSKMLDFNNKFYFAQYCGWCFFFKKRLFWGYFNFLRNLLKGDLGRCWALW